MRIEYIPTYLRLAENFMKPLQGEHFRILRAYLMGWRPISELLIQKDNKKTDRINENVGKREKTRESVLCFLLVTDSKFHFDST